MEPEPVLDLNLRSQLGLFYMIDVLETSLELSKSKICSCHSKT